MENIVELTIGMNEFLDLDRSLTKKNIVNKNIKNA